MLTHAHVVSKVAWKRSRTIEKELEKIAEKVKPLVEDQEGMSHKEASVSQEKFLVKEFLK